MGIVLNHFVLVILLAAVVTCSSSQNMNWLFGVKWKPNEGAEHGRISPITIRKSDMDFLKKLLPSSIVQHRYPYVNDNLPTEDDDLENQAIKGNQQMAHALHDYYHEWNGDQEWEKDEWVDNSRHVDPRIKNPFADNVDTTDDDFDDKGGDSSEDIGMHSEDDFDPEIHYVPGDDDLPVSIEHYDRDNSEGRGVTDNVKYYDVEHNTKDWQESKRNPPYNIIGQKMCPDPDYNIDLCQDKDSLTVGASGGVGVLLTCDGNITRADWLGEPRIMFRNARPDRKYCLVMVDPDAPTPDDNYMEHWLHWLIADIAGYNILWGDLTGNILADYKPPGPPSGTHRYQFFLYEQKCTYLKFPRDFDLQKRSNFPLRHFAEINEFCDPVATFQYLSPPLKH